MFNKKNKKVEQVRLNKFIASSGLCSRRKADELIEQGVVKVNGTVVKELGFSVSTKDKVTVNGQPLKKSNLVYIKYYKPAGYITTMSDEKGRKTIYDILPQEVKDLKPVGRLDKDSTGLLIMTNDGDFINKMTHPSIKIPKVYRVTAEGKMNQQHLLQMAKGICRFCHFRLRRQKYSFANNPLSGNEQTNKKNVGLSWFSCHFFEKNLSRYNKYTRAKKRTV